MQFANPYDELPYRSLPIEWTAPERLALASRLHGGPAPVLDGSRFLELGCADGANLLSLAWYRPGMEFVGVDGAASQIALASARSRQLGVCNVEFVAADFICADAMLSGDFDFIVAHGVFSWIPGPSRDALLDICRRRLRPGGLVYLNYNTRPGWTIRGMVRDFLVAQPAPHSVGLRERADHARDIAARLSASMEGLDHPYSRLLANEFRFVCDSDSSYVAHEFLAADNHAYWRSEFIGLAAEHGLECVADADFNHPSGRVSESLAAGLIEGRLQGRSVEDTMDLLCYRQLHSPILARAGLPHQPLEPGEFAALHLASCLAREECDGNAGTAMFVHPNGFQVSITDPTLTRALEQLAPLWPHGRPIATLHRRPEQSADDLRLLHRNGLVELRCVGAPSIDPGPLHRLEATWNGGATTPYHACAEVTGVARRSAAKAFDPESVA